MCAVTELPLSVIGAFQSTVAEEQPAVVRVMTGALGELLT